GMWARLSGASDSWQRFFAFFALIFSQSLLWATVAPWIKKGWHGSQDGAWTFWVPINFISLCLSLTGWLLYDPQEAHWAIRVLVPGGFFLLMLADFGWQF